MIYSQLATKPHYEKEKELKREAYNLKEKISAEKTLLKEIEKKQTAKIEKHLAKLKTLEATLLETEAKARSEKQTADSIYYSAFDLDLKNPIKIEEDLGDPAKMLDKLNRVESEIEQLQNSILNELTVALQNG